jgi:hypothetical protein
MLIPLPSVENLENFGGNRTFYKLLCENQT